MLQIKTKAGWIPLATIQNFSVTTSYEGDQSISFDISTKDSAYPEIKEETQSRFEDNEYLIKTINQRKHISTITAELDMNDWKANIFPLFHTEYKLLTDVLTLITPKGWIFEDAGLVTIRRAITLEGVTPYEVLMQCKKTYNIVFEYHTAEKRVKVIKPDTVQPRGLYMTDELNLQEVEYKGSTSEFVTRLYPYGKKTEVSDEEGNVLSTSYVNIAEINGGKEYIDDHTYSDVIISAYWQDDRYLDPQELMNDAVDKLKILAQPVKAYGCKLVDLSRINETYKMLDFKMYDKVTLIDSSGIRAMHQIVQYKRYPLNENLNEVTLSTEFKKITGTIDKMSVNISDIDTDLKRKENAINEVKRDVTSNTLRISNTYTKGEIDTKEETIISQTNEKIDLSVTKLETIINDTKIYRSPSNPEEPFEGMIWMDTSDPNNPVIYTWLQIGENNDGTPIFDWIQGNDYQEIQSLKNAYEQLTSEQWMAFVAETVFQSEDGKSLVKKDELKTQMQILKDQINATLEEMSGYNLILNSVGWNGTSFWELTEGTVEVINDNDVADNTVSEHAFKLTNGAKLTQTVKIMQGNSYTISCKYKRYMSICSLKIIQGGSQEDIVFSVDTTDYIDEDWYEAELTFIAVAKEAVVEMYSSADHLIVSDLIINDGTVKKLWTSHNDEIYTAGVKIDKTGIAIEQSDTDTRVKINSREFAVEDKNSGNTVLRVNQDTTELEKLKCRGSIQEGKMLVVSTGDRTDFVILD